MNDSHMHYFLYPLDTGTCSNSNALICNKLLGGYAALSQFLRPSQNIPFCYRSRAMLILKCSQIYMSNTADAELLLWFTSSRLIRHHKITNHLCLGSYKMQINLFCKNFVWCNLYWHQVKSILSLTAIFQISQLK